MEDSRSENKRRGRDECTKTCGTGRTVEKPDVTLGSRGSEESEDGFKQSAVRGVESLHSEDIFDRVNSIGVGDSKILCVTWVIGASRVCSTVEFHMSYRVCLLSERRTEKGPPHDLSVTLPQ